MKDNNEKEQIQMQIQKIRITQNFYANKSENSEKMYYFLEIIFYQKWLKHKFFNFLQRNWISTLKIYQKNKNQPTKQKASWCPEDFIAF